MSDAPLVSIVLPTYNGSRYLRRALDACLNQTYQNVEVIVVDDASTDETPSIIEDYCARDQRVRSVRHATNAKLPAALNTGHRLARGSFLTWTSDDNWYEPDAIAVMVEYLREHHEVGLAYCGYRIVTPDGGLIAVRDFPDAGNLWNECVVGACFLYRREVYEAVGEYDASAFLAEDLDYWFRINKRFRFGHVPNAIPYSYMHHPSSLTTTRAADVAIQAARVAAKHADSRVRARRKLCEGYFNAHWTCRVNGESKRALKHLMQAIVSWPLSPKLYRSLVTTGVKSLRSAESASKQAAR
jgi:glycosyltransferase involved in cell wall biosynthesis